MGWKFADNEPIYNQIVSRILTQLITGEIEPGNRLPSTRDLAVDAGVNLNTAQRAYVELENRSVIYTKRGSGRFVTEDKEIVEALKIETVKTEVKKFYNRMTSMGVARDRIIELILEMSEVR